MTLSAIGGSSATSSPYTTNSSTSRRKSGEDPMSQAISSLQTTDPTLASKLTDLQKQVASMKKSGASEKDVQSAMESTMDGLSATEKSELKSAMPAPPASRKGGHGGHPSGPPPSGTSSSSSSSSSNSDVASFSMSSFLDSSSSMQNDSIMSLISARTSASA